jgi:predicted ATPase
MRAEAIQGFRFGRVRLQNWRNFLDVTVDMQRRVFLVGPNASGKSNLLDAFRFLRDIAATGGGFQEAVHKRGGVSSLRCLAARRYPDITIAVDVAGPDGGGSWSYELQFYQDNLRRPVIRRETVSLNGQALMSRPDTDDESDMARLTQTHLEQVNVNRAFRGLAEFFRSVRYLHIVPQLVREPDRSIGRSDDPYGGDFLEQVARKDKRVQGAWLRKIQEALRVAVPQLSELELKQDERGMWHLRGKYEHWRPQGAWQSEGDFSDGTLRLIGLLWAVLDGSGPLLLEEPEMSLHPEVVRYLPQMLARAQRRTGRQILVSTHSSDLLLDSGIGLDEVLLVEPSTEGSSVRPASAFREIKPLLDGGSTLAEAVVPRTRPRGVEQLALFGDR